MPVFATTITQKMDVITDDNVISLNVSVVKGNVCVEALIPEFKKRVLQEKQNVSLQARYGRYCICTITPSVGASAYITLIVNDYAKKILTPDNRYIVT